jgi:hypothetical protein
MRLAHSSRCRAAPGTMGRFWRASYLRACCSCPASTASATPGQRIRARPTSSSVAKLLPTRRRRSCVNALDRACPRAHCAQVYASQRFQDLRCAFARGRNSQPPRPEVPRSGLEGPSRRRKRGYEPGHPSRREASPRPQDEVVGSRTKTRVRCRPSLKLRVAYSREQT